MNFYGIRTAIRRLPGIVIRVVPIPEPRIIQGPGSRAEVGAICKAAGYRSILLVTDQTLNKLGFQQQVMESLEEAGIPCRLFCNINSEPCHSIIQEGRQAALACKADCIIALGGGSVLDSCKAIAASARAPKLPLACFMGKFAFIRSLPMISIPSTAGTGAEMTVGTVVKNARGVKKSTVIVGLRVTDVILDSELSLKAPRRVTAACGIDALSHGLEGCLADVKSTDDDLRKSQECVRLVLENLPALLEDGNDIEGRQWLCLAANYGGNAINKQLAGYVHAFAHTIGARYHIPHGEAIAYCLLPLLDFQKEICGDKLYRLALYCGFGTQGDDTEAAVDALLSALQELLDKCGFSGGCKAIDERDYPLLIRGINWDSINYSPSKTLRDEEIASLLDTIRKGAL